MINLETHNKHVFEMFQNGYHVIRRSNTFWGGLGADLVIEQTLMRTLKTAGGLTRVGGMREAQRGRWTLALPLVTEYSQGMDDVTGITYSTSEQLIDTSSARITCDHEDTGKVLNFITEFSPYTSDECLRNIVTGVVADDAINVHELISVGKRIVEEMDGKDVFTYSFCRKDKVKALSEPSKIIFGDGREVH